MDDLFARTARLPFTVSGPTAQSVTEALRPPTPLFVLHFLCQHAVTLHAALGIIQAYPHRLLMDDIVRVPIAEADEIDADVVTDILLNPEHWMRPHSQVLIAEQMQGYAPTIVQQRRAEESCDTPENRFVKHFLQQLLLAADSLPAQSWWLQVPAEWRG
ncbi:MAG: DUF2357 domain-containing protein [Anaerolineae bacterium]